MLHYVTIFMVGRVKDGTMAEPQASRFIEVTDRISLLTPLQLMEPDKCRGWEKIAWGDMKTTGEEQIEVRSEGEGAEQRLKKRLFEPLISLLVSRPGVKPCLS